MRVVTIAAASNRRVISALVATVVPWENSETSESSMPAASTPAITPSIGSEGAGDLRHVDVAAVLIEDEHVGEGPADIDGYTKSWHARLPTHMRRERPTTTTSRPEGGSCTEETGGVLLSRALAGQVPSALRGLTALFGMGRGVSPSLKPPEIAESLPAAPQNCTAVTSPEITKLSVKPSTH